MLLALSSAPAAVAQKLDKAAKEWLDGVAPLLTPEEDKTYRSLADPADVTEFQKIFWARRDPDPKTPENEFQKVYEARRAEADRKYSAGSKKGTTTDCGKVFLLLGAPDEVKAQNGSADAHLRQPEVWTYKNRPGFTFEGGKLDLAFGACELPKNDAFWEGLQKVAASRIVQPNLEYKMSGGRLVKLEDMLPKPSPAVGLLREARQDFALTAVPVVQFRGRDGATYVAGFVRGDAAGLGLPADQSAVPIAMAADLVDDAGKTAASTERDANAQVDSGALLASFGLPVKPGKYTLRTSMYEPRSKKGATTSMPLEVVDYGTAFGTTKLLVATDIVQGATTDPKDALAGFALGTTRLIPRYGNTFTKADSIQLLAIVYGAKPGPSGKPSVTASFSIVFDGKDKAKAPDQSHETESPIPAVGPIALATYEPGTYTARLKVKDNVSGQELTQEATFDVK